MKFIHLSDLHLGKRVNEYSMLEDQEYILKKIVNVVVDEKPDGVIIAGDIYDKSKRFKTKDLHSLILLLETLYLDQEISH